jgi:hypothetical protein
MSEAVQTLIVLFATDALPIIIALEMTLSTIAPVTRLRVKALEFVPAPLDTLARMGRIALHVLLENTRQLQGSKIWLEAVTGVQTDALQLSLLLSRAKV